MDVIATDNLSKRYGPRRGIQNIGLSVRRGEIFGFLGPNGAGKSTAIRVLLGFLRATSGSARVFGRDCWNDGADIRRHVGYVPGDVRLYSWLTLNRALQFVSEVRHASIHAHGMELARRFCLEADLPVHRMSRGNRQKLALVLALAHRPQLAVLDEPTSGLDPLMQDVLMDCLRETADAGGTVFFSSHTLSEVESLCDRVAVVREGTIVTCKDLEVLRREAPRVINLMFASAQSAASVAWPDFLRFQKRYGNRCEVHMTGPAAELIAWCAQHPITDIDVGRPGLEAVFRQFYRDDTAGVTE